VNNNQKYNQAAIKKFRKELEAMFGDIKDIDIKCLNKAVNEGVAEAKSNTNVVSGFMKKNWKTTPAIKTSNGVTKKLYNSMDYSSYVNYGHRLVNKSGETVGWVNGQYMLEKAINKIDKALIREFKKEVEKVNRKHDK